MRRALVPWWLAGGVVLLCAAVVMQQRLDSQRLRSELDAVHARSQASKMLRKANAELQLAPGTLEEHAKLRAEHEAITRLRDEIAAARRKENSEAIRADREIPAGTATEPTLVNRMIVAAAWRNTGQATPAAAAETLLWAAADGDIDVLAGLLELPDAARARAEEILSKLSPEAREQYGTPERLVALLTAKDVPLGKAGILNEPSEAEEYSPVVLKLQNPEGLTRKFPLVLHRQQDGWRILVPANAVQNYGAKLLGQPLPWEEEPWKP